jgi:hypothetical protein
MIPRRNTEPNNIKQFLFHLLSKLYERVNTPLNYSILSIFRPVSRLPARVFRSVEAEPEPAEISDQDQIIGYPGLIALLTTLS